MQLFSLQPYPVEVIPDVQIQGNVDRSSDDLLTIQYELLGETDHILFPDISTQPSRKDDLWKATCFEFFLAIPNQPQYWEFNLSPSGNWNVYTMDAYRQVNMREEASIARLPFRFNMQRLEVSFDLKLLFNTTQPLQLGITTIIRTKSGPETYWALTHPGPRADFHLRESFTLLI